MKKMDDNKVCQSTPPGTLLEQIMDPNQSKSEREWAASREIADLREQLAAKEAMIQSFMKEMDKDDKEIEFLHKDNERMREALKNIHKIISSEWIGPHGKQIFSIFGVIAQALAPKEARDGR